MLCAARGGRFPTDLKRSKTKLFHCVLLKKQKVICDQDVLRKISIKGKIVPLLGTGDKIIQSRSLIKIAFLFLRQFL